MKKKSHKKSHKKWDEDKYRIPPNADELPATTQVNSDGVITSRPFYVNIAIKPHREVNEFGLYKE
jgi:hypothetical protein